MKTVIEMAREAGFWREHTDTWMCNTEDIERFAELVRAESLDQPAQVQSPAAKVVELCRLENDSAALTPRIVAIDQNLQIGQMLYTSPQPPVQPEKLNGVLVPLDVLEAAESSLGSFCSDLGWGDDDMQNMDNLSAYIARYKAVKSRGISMVYKTFTAPRYRDPNGAPTCCAGSDVLDALEAGKHYAEEALSRHVEAYGRHPATEPEHNAILVDIATIDDAINKAIENKRNQHDKT